MFLSEHDDMHNNCSAGNFNWSARALLLYDKYASRPIAIQKFVK